jgi:hypothetical protein
VASPAPPPAPDNSGAPVSGIQDTRSNLLGQISAGLKLKKVDVSADSGAAKPSSAADVFNVSAILQRYDRE